jgi:hypothetical protein
MNVIMDMKPHSENGIECTPKGKPEDDLSLVTPSKSPEADWIQSAAPYVTFQGHWPYGF